MYSLAPVGGKVHNWVHKSQGRRGVTMGKLKEMPYSEKYTIIVANMNDTFVPSFVQKHLGDQAVAELQRIWGEGIKPVAEGASFEEKYEMAYGNWVWMAKSSVAFIREQLGEDGIEQFKRAEVEALKRKSASPALFLLRLVRALSPNTAFKMIANKFTYQLQWITPFSVSEMTQYRVVYDIPRCKILDYPDSEDLCVIGCQSAYPTWVAEQFKVKMEFGRQGNSCKCTLTPLG
jgi:hypothetical protein